MVSKALSVAISGAFAFAHHTLAQEHRVAPFRGRPEAVKKKKSIFTVCVWLISIWALDKNARVPDHAHAEGSINGQNTSKIIETGFFFYFGFGRPS